ncbi:MAG: class I SAM-dependent methyltransferase [Rhodospirillaceae bacterium]|nr:class I SAM-dependent methyltransferase [Rhodospirillaceae bacterium]
MGAEQLGKSRLLNLLFKPAGATMESRLRRWLMPPEKTLRGAGLKPGQTVLEVGSGTGFFTLAAAEMIGENGCLIAIEPLADYAARATEKVRAAGLTNVEVLCRDALDTGLDAASIDTALLFGVIPFPSLPLDRLLPEMHRVLKPDGSLAVWLFPTTAGVPTAILRSGLFTGLSKKHGVYAFERCEAPGGSASLK